MKILLVTTPIRPTPTPFPPFGSLSLLNYLRKNGVEDVHFYDIDCLRPSFDQTLARIKEIKPDILGISAVVSTAYAYSKKLSLAIKQALPDTLVVLGGNMGASAEILLHKTGIDLVVLGEGEKTLLKIAQRAEQTRDLTAFADIPGLAIKARDGSILNTGYEVQLPASELYDIDWGDLEKGSRIEHFFPVLDKKPAMMAEYYNNDPRIWEPHRAGKTFGYIYTSKGCVSRCTFCHRWDKGLRSIPVETVIKRIEELKTRYNVGFLKMADENFGADHRWLGGFCDAVKPLDLLWNTGSRVKGVSSELLTMVRDAGCVVYSFGIEHGSERMLTVMEKKTTVEDNRNAYLTSQAMGMTAPIALVLGMPGESPDTIREAIAFCQMAKTVSEDLNPNDLSINYAQALPGTPLYEFARHKEMIGRSLDEEEKYLLDISDKDAHDEYSTLNFTEYPTLTLHTWRPLITIETNWAFVHKYGLKSYLRNLLTDANFFEQPAHDSGYFANPRRLMTREDGASPGPAERDPTPPPLMDLVRRGQWGLAIICYPVLSHRLRHLLPLMVAVKAGRKFGWGYAGKLAKEWLAFWLDPRRLLRKSFEYRSLRKILDQELGALPTDNPAVESLRRGR